MGTVKFLPGTSCHNAGHDDMEPDEHWEAHSISMAELAEELEEKKAAGWKSYRVQKS